MSPAMLQRLSPARAGPTRSASASPPPFTTRRLPFKKSSSPAPVSVPSTVADVEGSDNGMLDQCMYCSKALLSKSLTYVLCLCMISNNTHSSIIAYSFIIAYNSIIVYSSITVIGPLKWIMPPSLAVLRQAPALTCSERQAVLDKREKLMRQGTNKQSDLSKAKATKGCCPDMCPERERYLREERRRVHIYEMIANTESVSI